MWKLVDGYVRGTSHVQTGQPCQDYCAGTTTGETAIAVCSDGAGSAEYSHVGSKAAVEQFLDEMTQLESIPTREQMVSWVDAARERVLHEAESQAATPRQLACTFLAAIVGDEWAAFAQIGDGVIVFDGPDGYELAFWPDNGEYANTTRFLTYDDYQRHLRVEILQRRISEFALLTDGLQMLALDYGEARVHDRFFRPLFSTVRNGPDEQILKTALLEFMGSKRVNERTDDDKTLILATRIDDSPQLPDPTS